MYNQTDRSQGGFINTVKLETSADELSFFTRFLEKAHLGRMNRVELKSSASVGEQYGKLRLLKQFQACLLFLRKNHERKKHHKQNLTNKTKI